MVPITKIKPEHFQKAIKKFENASPGIQMDLLLKMCDEQPKVGGQLTSLSIVEGVSTKELDGAFKMTYVILEAVKNSGHKLPFLTHEMFEKEQVNVV
jgi:hypothetical protein